MAKVIKLTDNNNNTLLPVTDASYIQMKVGDDVRSVKDVIIENEEITALALNDLHSTKQEKLISGVTIKTINDESLIGAGDINLPEVYDVRFVFSSNSWVCNHTYSEINTAFNDGKLIVGVVGTSGNSPKIDGYSIPFGPLDFGDMTNIPDYCFLTAVRQTASPPYELFSMIMEYSSTERILITFKIDSNNAITVHAESIGGTGEANTITGGAANQIVYQTAANTTGFIDAPTTDGTVLKYTSRDGIIWGTDNNTDTKVSVAKSSLNYSYPVLFKYNANNDAETTSIRYDSTGTTNFNYNPSTNTLTATNITSTSISASEVVIQGESVASNYAKLASPTFTGTPTAPTASAGTNTTQIATTAFVTTAVSNNTLKYTVKAISSNAVSFTTSAKMKPNTVYVCGSVNSSTNMFTFGLVNSLSIASGALDSDIGIMWSSRQATITNNKVVPTYQIVFRCSSSGASITLPNNIVWRDGSAPAASDLVNKWCELTIMNDIATIIII